MGEGGSGVTLQQAQAIYNALMAGPDLRWDAPQDGCHARGVLMVETMQQMGVPFADIGKLYAFHRDQAGGGGWQVTTRDGLVVYWGEHVASTMLGPNGQPLVLDPALADVPLDVSGWINRLGAPDFQHPVQTVAYAQGMLVRMNTTNVNHLLFVVQTANPAAYHYLISGSAARSQLQQLGVILPAAPELGWMHLLGTQPKDAARFLKDLGKGYQTGAIIAVGFGQGPFPDVPFDTASRFGTGVAEAKRYLAGL
jgi:hypothetical protein